MTRECHLRPSANRCTCSYEVKPNTKNPIDTEGEFKDKIVLHPMKIDEEKVKKEMAKEKAKAEEQASRDEAARQSEERED